MYAKDSTSQIETEIVSVPLCEDDLGELQYSIAILQHSLLHRTLVRRLPRRILA